ncbi:MAG: class I SAM-dependent methyltransferase [Blastocatellia bacterium]
MAFACRICGNASNLEFYQAREMMFGTRAVFQYAECHSCAVLQIVEIPDLAVHYPVNYYSLSGAYAPVIDEKVSRRIAAREIGRFLFGGRKFPGKLLAHLKPQIAEHFPRWLFPLRDRIDFNSRILDFGCGRGRLLRELQIFGFRNLVGADRFIEKEIISRGLTIIRRDLAELEPAFDLIMLHHSFEHLPNPRSALSEMRRLLGYEAKVLIRMPLLNFAWEKYRTDWVQLDAPRHLFIFSEEGFRRLALREGFQVENVIFDSTGFQFYGSEQYRLDIAGNEPRAFRGVGENSIFSQEQIDEWEQEAAKLNSEGRGDQACFYLSAEK